MREDYLKNLKRFAAAALALAVTVSALLGCGGGIKAYAGSKNGGDAGDGALFTDVKITHWAHDEIGALAEAGVIDGYPDGSFRPSASVTYGEFIKMMYAAVNGDDLIAAAGAGTGSAKAGEKSGAGSRNEHWAAPYYYAALAEGYFDGSSIEIGLLDKKIPRKHMAHASAGVVRTLAVESSSEAKGSAEFSDVLPAGEFAYDIMTACGSGILSGYPDGTFSGNKTLTRAEAASVIKRLAEYKEKALSAAVAAGEEQLADNGQEDGNGGLAVGEKKSGKKIVRRVEKADRVIPVSYEVIDSTFAARGIVKAEYDGAGMIKIYSEVEYPFIKIMNTDGSLMKSIGSPEGSFFKEDGMFVYLSVPEGKAFGAEQNEIYMIFDDESERAYKFSGVVL